MGDLNKEDEDEVGFKSRNDHSISTPRPVLRAMSEMTSSYSISSVKPFKSKNRDKIYLDAPNPNLKKGCDRDFLRQPNL